MVEITMGDTPMHISGLDVRLHITYRAGDGVVTERMVTLHGADGRRMARGSTVLDDLHCYCHLRHMARVFRVERVQRAADADGVIIDDLGAWIMKAAKLD